MFNILLEYGFPVQIVAAIQQLYNNSKGIVAVNGNSSEPFNINTGVLQGDVLAPFLFIIVIDHVLRKFTNNFGFEYEQRKSRRHEAKIISDLDYADDIALLEKLVSIANEQIAILNAEALQVGLVINAEKTEYMAFNQPPEDQVLVLNGRPLKQVSDFQYLGSKMSSSANDFKRRKGLAWSAFWDMGKIWRARHVSTKLKINIFKASVLSIFLYGSETWIISADMANKINSFATSCYRIMLGVRRIDKVPNDTIYQVTGEKPLLVAVQQRQLRWVGHALRRDPFEPSNIFALYEPAPSHGRIHAGRPATSFRQYIASLLTTASASKDLTAKQIAEMANNRDLWAKRIADIGR
jgi:hypothetical protein